MENIKGWGENNLFDIIGAFIVALQPGLGVKMIKTENGATEVIIESPEELFIDVKNVIAAFIKFSKQLQESEEIIEQTLIKMIVDGFHDNGDLKIIDDRK